MAIRFHTDSADISIRSSSQAIVDKTTVEQIIDSGGTLGWELSYGNLSSENIEYTDWVDIFPYNGDFNGTSTMEPLSSPVRPSL
ncbi:MAG: hypothetical protein R3C44_15085 [Chloroflexota bacterium]